MTVDSAKKKQKDKRQSVEDRLDNLSDTLLAMKELLVHKGLVEGIPPKDTGNVGTTEKSTSDTTIYQNALEKLTDQNTQVVVDPEILF